MSHLKQRFVIWINIFSLLLSTPLFANQGATLQSAGPTTRGTTIKNWTLISHINHPKQLTSQTFVRLINGQYRVASTVYMSVPNQEKTQLDPLTTLAKSFGLAKWHPGQSFGSYKVYEALWSKGNRTIRLALDDQTATGELRYLLTFIRPGYQHDLLKEIQTFEYYYLGRDQKSPATSQKVMAALFELLLPSASAVEEELLPGAPGVEPVLGDGLNLDVHHQVGLDPELMGGLDHLNKNLGGIAALGDPMNMALIGVATAGGAVVGAAAAHLLVAGIKKGSQMLYDYAHEKITHKKEKASLLKDFNESLKVYEETNSSIVQLERILDQMMMQKQQLSMPSQELAIDTIAATFAQAAQPLRQDYEANDEGLQRMLTDYQNFSAQMDRLQATTPELKTSFLKLKNLADHDIRQIQASIQRGKKANKIVTEQGHRLERINAQIDQVEMPSMDSIVSSRPLMNTNGNISIEALLEEIDLLMAQEEFQQQKSAQAMKSALDSEDLGCFTQNYKAKLTSERQMQTFANLKKFLQSSLPKETNLCRALETAVSELSAAERLLEKSRNRIRSADWAIISEQIHENEKSRENDKKYFQRLRRGFEKEKQDLKRSKEATIKRILNERNEAIKNCKAQSLLRGDSREELIARYNKAKLRSSLSAEDTLRFGTHDSKTKAKSKSKSKLVFSQPEPLSWKLNLRVGFNATFAPLMSGNALFCLTNNCYREAICAYEYNRKVLKGRSYKAYLTESVAEANQAHNRSIKAKGEIMAQHLGMAFEKRHDFMDPNTSDLDGSVEQIRANFTKIVGGPGHAARMKALMAKRNQILALCQRELAQPGDDLDEEDVDQSFGPGIDSDPYSDDDQYSNEDQDLDDDQCSADDQGSSDEDDFDALDDLDDLDSDDGRDSDSSALNAHSRKKFDDRDWDRYLSLLIQKAKRDQDKKDGKHFRKHGDRDDRRSNHKQGHKHHSNSKCRPDKSYHGNGHSSAEHKKRDKIRQSNIGIGVDFGGSFDWDTNQNRLPF